MNAGNIEQKIKNFIKTMDADVVLFLKGLGHLAPELTTAAVVAETVAGSPELIPLTVAAGKAAEVIGEDVSANGIVNSVIDAKVQVESVIKIAEK